MENREVSMESKINDFCIFIDLLSIPVALIKVHPSGSACEVFHSNPSFKKLFSKWLSETPPIPNALLSSIETRIYGSKGVGEAIFSYVEDLQQLFRIDLSKLNEDLYALFVSENVGSCLLNKSHLGSKGGCSCILNKFSEGRVVVDVNGIILAYNDVAQRYANQFIANQLVLGENFSHLIPEEESKSLTLNISRALLGESFYIDFTKKTGIAEETIRFSYSPVFDSSDKPFAVLITFESLADQQNAEKKMVLSNDFYKHTLDVLGDGYWIWSTLSQDLFVSKQVYSQLGYSQKDFIPTVDSFNKLLHPADSPRIVKQLKELADGKRKRFELEFRMLTKSGDYKWLHARAGVFESSGNGDTRQIVGATIDITEQRKTQDDLFKSENRLKKAQEIARIGSWEEHPNQSKGYWSDETYNIFGFKRGEIQPSFASILKHVDKEKRELIEKLLLNVKLHKKEPKQKIPFSYKSPLQEEKYLLINAEPFSGTDGKVQFWQGVVQDISWQRNYEKFLKEGRENLMALVTNMPALVFATDKAGNFVFWNRACEDVTGYKSKEIVGNKDALKLLYPESELRRKIRNQLKDMGMSLSTWEHQITTKKGDKRDIVWSAFSEYVKVEGWSAVAIGYDITYQKNNERIQRAYQRKLEALAETATDFVGMSMDDSLFHYLGTQFEKHIPGHVFIVKSYDSINNFLTIEGVYGLKTKDWEQILSIMGWNPVGRRFHVTPPMRSVFTRTKLVKVDLGIYEFTEGVVSSISARNLEKFLNLNSIYTVGLLKDSNLLGGVVIFTRGDSPNIDFSIVEGLVNQAAVAIDRHNLENQLVLAKEKAEEADRLKSAFLANMSHEIRTPMNAILGFSQLLNLPNLTKEKRKQYIDIINAKGNMLVKLINDIIDASKVEAGQLTLVYSPCRINELLRGMKRFWDKERVFQNREPVEIRLTLPEKTERLEILTDEGRLEQIFTNLISNAIKFTEKGFVEFGYNIEGATIYFFVKDSGIGIDLTQQQVIFDRFRQAGDSTTRSQGGTGLGLAISKGIVDLMGGSIWVESTLGKGAEFYFSLPLKEVISETVVPIVDEPEPEIHTPDWKNKVMLLAEDEEVNYIFINELLQPTGVTVLWAKDGLQAVELVKNIKKIDVILMDIKMPNMNGYAATMEIRHINPDIPIIAQTAYAFSEDRQKAEAAGCDEYITKPIKSIELFQIIDRFIG